MSESLNQRLLTALDFPNPACPDTAQVQPFPRRGSALLFVWGDHVGVARHCQRRRDKEGSAIGNAKHEGFNSGAEPSVNCCSGVARITPEAYAVGMSATNSRQDCSRYLRSNDAKKNDANPEPLTNSQRELLGKQLWHAFRHVVPPPFLTAFLTEYGSARRRGDFTKHSSVEPGFSDWIIDRHCENSDSSELRDWEYSGIILDEVANRMGMADDFTDDDEPSFSGDEDDEDDDDGFDWDGRSRAS